MWTGLYSHVNRVVFACEPGCIRMWTGLYSHVNRVVVPVRLVNWYWIEHILYGWLYTSNVAMIKIISVSPDPTLSEKFGEVGGCLFFGSGPRRINLHFTILYIILKASFDKKSCTVFFTSIFWKKKHRIKRLHEIWFCYQNKKKYDGEIWL